jgi:hypothetical protein
MINYQPTNQSLNRGVNKEWKKQSNKKSIDHDFASESITPFGIMDAKADTVDINLAESKVTADFIVDKIEDHWYKYYFQSTKMYYF